MKIIRTLFLLTILVTLFSCKQDGGEKVFTPEDVKNPATAEGIDPKVAEKMPIITFDKLTYDLGRVVQGEKLTYNFKFTNTGKSDLIISNVRASCNCTSPTPPKAPIRPAEHFQFHRLQQLDNEHEQLLHDLLLHEVLFH